MSLVDEWRALQASLSGDWMRVTVQLRIPDPEAAAQASALLAPAGPYRAEPGVLQFASARDGSAQGPNNVTRLLRGLDDAHIKGTLTALGSEKAIASPERQVTTLAESWDAMISELPSDWSDLVAEVTFTSTDYVEHAAVHCIQLNPRRADERAAFRFRAAHHAGYGVSPQMARRCFERCDEANIRGSIAILRVLSGTHLAATQGPVWNLDGQTV